ncbi:MAG: DUF4159 domain-containing protein, partial [Gemmatimonadota bacterium]
PEPATHLAAEARPEILHHMAEENLARPAVSEELEPVRLSDFARAGAARGIARTGPGGTAPGLVRFAPLSLHGAGSGLVFLQDLTYFLRTRLGVEARVDGDLTRDRFLHPSLLEYPVHFLFGGGAVLNPVDGLQVEVVPEELEQLRRYLAGGGLLYLEGTGPFLAQMASALRQIAPPGSRLAQVPFDHPLYRAAYPFRSGFPGEGRRAEAPPGPEWYYPASGGPTDRREVVDPGLPQGLWGVESQGELVALLSDLDLFAHWEPDVPIDQADEEEAPVKQLRLQAAANVVVYALTRPHGVAQQRAAPIWSENR